MASCPRDTNTRAAGLDAIPVPCDTGNPEGWLNTVSIFMFSRQSQMLQNPAA
jgi:hypothetical protein